MKNENGLILILDNIRSAHNVGSIFRTADASGVSKIFLIGVTPDPVDRFGRARRDVSKVALGGERSVPWEHTLNLVSLIKKLKKDKVSVVALEQAEGSTDYKKFKPKFPMALILGEEVRGVSKKVLDLCDEIIEIPMMGEKESLNVSVAAGIALFSLNKDSKN